MFNTAENHRDYNPLRARARRRAFATSLLAAAGVAGVLLAGSIAVNARTSETVEARFEGAPVLSASLSKAAAPKAVERGGRKVRVIPLFARPGDQTGFGRK